MRHERQERPVSACKQKEGDRADQRRAQVSVVPRVAESGEDGTRESLDRKPADTSVWRVPPQQRANDAEITDRVDPEGRRDP